VEDLQKKNTEIKYIKKKMMKSLFELVKEIKMWYRIREGVRDGQSIW